MKHINEFKFPNFLETEKKIVSGKEFDDIIFNTRIEIVKLWCAAKYYHLYSDDKTKMADYIQKLTNVIVELRSITVENYNKYNLIKKYLIETYDINEREMVVNITCDMFKNISNTYYAIILSKYFTNEIDNLLKVLSNKISIETYIIKTFVEKTDNIIFVYDKPGYNTPMHISENWKRLFEMAIKLKDFKNKFENLTVQIVENWCLCKYCCMYDQDNQNFNHWITEFRAHAENIKQLTLKDGGGNKSKHIMNVLKSKYLDDSDIVFETITGKFKKEQFNNQKWIEIISNEFVSELENICLYLGTNVDTNDYILCIFGKEIKGE